MPERHRPDGSPKRIGNEVGYAGVSSRKKCLQDLDGQTDCKSKKDSDRRRTLHSLQQREISTKKEAEGNEPNHVNANVLPVVPVRTKFIPWSLKKLSV